MYNKAKTTELVVRKGFTSVEALVIIGIVGLLISLLLPAVAAARANAKKISCANNLRQIGLGISSYTSNHDCFPLSITYHYASGRSSSAAFYSASLRVLPYIEMNDLFNAANMQICERPIDGLAWTRSNKMTEDEKRSSNATVYNASVSVFVCPSEIETSPHRNDYRGNTGVGPTGSTSAERPDGGNGIFPEHGTIRVGDITDGLSHTAAYSERTCGNLALGKVNPMTSFFISRETAVPDAQNSLDTCRVVGRSDNNNVYNKAGSYWFWTGRERTLYNHSQTPNGRVPDCFHGTVTTAIGMATARSYHRGGVNVLLGDGSTRFVGDSVTAAIWKALGSRNGGEIID